MANLDLQDAHLLVPAHEDFKKYNCALYFKLLPTSSRSYFSVSVKVHLFIYVFIRKPHSHQLFLLEINFFQESEASVLDET